MTEDKKMSSTTSTPLTRDALFAFQPRTRTVDLPDFGASVTVRELRTSESTEFTKRQAQSAEKGVAYLMATAVQQPDGTAMFTADDSVDDLPSKFVDVVTRAIIDLSFQMPGSATKS
jgi:hypothetical protein